MKFNKIYRVFIILVVLSLLVIVIPASPALAAESIELSPDTGKTGDVTKIKGDGFQSEARVYIYFSSQEGAVYDRIDDNGVTVYKLAKRTTADVDGKINTSCEVPGMLDEGFEGRYNPEDIVAGTYYVYATYDDDDRIEAVTEFTVRGIELTPASGLADDAVKVTGAGFAEESGISITFAGEDAFTTPSSIKTDKDGNFTASFGVPDVTAAIYSVRAEDEAGNDAEAEFTVEVAPGISISPVTTETKPAYVAMNLTISGSGFKANTPITITDTTSGILLTTTTSNTDGAFQATFAAAGSAGQHQITASDGTNLLAVSFIMESEAPPKPALLLPENNTEAEAQAYFGWENVTDDSLPVTYALQLASGEDFTPSSIILEKTGLTASEYTVTRGEKLESTGEEAPYYWRVKAMDGATNESEWSTAGSFYIPRSPEPGLPAQPERSIWSSWLIYLWIGLGVAVAISLGFWLRRRIARLRQA